MWLDWSKRAHRGLRTWILIILSREPRNGAEIMSAMDSGTRGWWRPSPGSVYPMLQHLSEQGLIKKRDDGRYEITTQGKEEVDWPSRFSGDGSRAVPTIVSEISSNVSYLEDLARAHNADVRESAEEIRGLAERLGRLGSSA